jgi:hypothetical protein
LEFIDALFRLDLADPKVVKGRIKQYPIAQDHPRLLSRLRSVLDEMKS